MLFEQRTQIAKEGLDRFVRTPLRDLLGSDGERDGQAEAVALFHRTAATVPAYREFMRSHDIDPESVDSYEKFVTLPAITKENYLLRHPLPALCRGGALEQCDMIAVSSGSTGAPCFWPRFLTDEAAIAACFEQVFHGSFRADERRTLAVVCFTLGTWVGGMYTAGCARLLALKGYPITVITPGGNRAEIFRAVRELGPLFDQTVLFGYPPFLKGIVDEGRAVGIDWAGLHTRWVMAGEVFSEEWRSLVGERVGSKDPIRDSASLYGTADAGVLGNETPLSICIRRWLSQNPAAASGMFGEERLPTLVQYDPVSRYFEEVDGQLLFSGDNGIPLVRYNILDTGGLIHYEAMLERLRGLGFDPLQALGSDLRGLYRLPFAYVFGRSSFAISYYGANIYPENISVGLEQPELKEWVTGKFVMEAREDRDRNAYLSVVVELAPHTVTDAPPSESDLARCAEAAAVSIRSQLLRLNSEFANYVPVESQVPRVELRPAGDPEYFPPGVKHRYTRR